MAQIGELTVAFSADTKDLQTGIKQAGQTVKQSGQQLQNAFGAKGQMAVGSTTSAVINFNRVIQDAPYGIIGVANNLDPLAQSFQGLRASTGSARAAIMTLLKSAFTGPGALITVVSLAGSALVLLQRRMSGTGDAGKKAKAGIDAFTGALNDQIKAINKLAYGESTKDQLRAAERQKEAYQEALAELEKMADVNQQVDFKTAISTGNTTAFIIAGINDLLGTSIDQEEQQKIVSDAINDIKTKIEETEGKILGLKLANNSETLKGLSQDERRLEIAKQMANLTGQEAKNLQDASRVKMPEGMEGLTDEELKKFFVDNYQDPIDKLVPSIQKVNNQFAGMSTHQILMGINQQKLNQQFEMFTAIGEQFTGIMVSGFANLVQSGQDFADVLENIGRMLASTAIQFALKAFLTGGLSFAGKGFFGSGGGLFGSIGRAIFPGAGSAPVMGNIPALSGQNVMVGGQFQLKGTDLVASITKTQNSILR